MSALHVAAEEGRSDTLEVLVHHGVDVNDEDTEGHTALYRAAKHELLEAGADVGRRRKEGFGCQGRELRSFGGAHSERSGRQRHRL